MTAEDSTQLGGLGRQDLRGAFARADALAGKLPPRKKQVSNPDDAPDAGPSVSKEFTGRTRRARVAEKPKVERGGSTHGTAFHVRSTVATAAKLQVRDGKVGSNWELVVLAIEASQDRLPALVERNSPSAPSSNALFMHRQASRRVTNEAQSPLTVRVTQEDCSVLDRLVTETGAVSRSQIVDLALGEYLDGTPEA